MLPREGERKERERDLRKQIDININHTVSKYVRRSVKISAECGQQTEPTSFQD